MKLDKAKNAVSGRYEYIDFSVMKSFLQLSRAMIVFACFFNFLLVHADMTDSNEYTLKAAFVYNLARMVNWPPERLADTAQPLEICLLGEDRFGAAIDALRNKKVRRHPIDIHYYRQLNEEDDLSHCHLLFIQDSEAAQLNSILSHLAARPILTVSDITGFAEQGGMVTLAMGSDQRIRLEINRHAAQQADLHISARLLALARLVETLE